jgi:predicted negative regulator of RcsB-dependent stress response
MPKTNTPAALAADDLDVDSLMDTLSARRREITIGVIVVAVVAGGLLLWRMSVNQKNDRAERALTEASNALYAGNRPLAMTQLQTIADRYGDTAAGVEGAMLLAELDFEDAKQADGMKVLDGLKGSGAAGNFKAPIDGLVAGAYADQKKYDDAAKQYQAAADESDYQSSKDVYQADAARMLMLAGKKDAARKIWQDLASRPDSPSVAEAKVRLGELDAVPATKN